MLGTYMCFVRYINLQIESEINVYLAPDNAGYLKTTCLYGQSYPYRSMCDAL